jgi:hypothetical protein
VDLKRPPWLLSYQGTGGVQRPCLYLSSRHGLRASLLLHGLCLRSHGGVFPAAGDLVKSILTVSVVESPYPFPRTREPNDPLATPLSISLPPPKPSVPLLSSLARRSLSVRSPFSLPARLSLPPRRPRVLPTVKIAQMDLDDAAPAVAGGVADAEAVMDVVAEP